MAETDAATPGAQVLAFLDAARLAVSECAARLHWLIESAKRPVWCDRSWILAGHYRDLWRLHRAWERARVLTRVEPLLSSGSPVQACGVWGSCYHQAVWKLCNRVLNAVPYELLARGREYKDPQDTPSSDVEGQEPDEEPYQFEGVCPRDHEELKRRWPPEIWESIRQTLLSIEGFDHDWVMESVRSESFGVRKQLALSPVAGPRWDSHQRELWLGPRLLKRYAREAGNQHLLLQAFQEAGWERQVQSPLDRERTAQTIRDLNRELKNSPLRFCWDDKGRCANWRLR